MEAERKLLKIAGILYGVIGALLLSAPVYGVFLIVTGIYFFSQADEDAETLYKNRVIHYILAAIGIANLVGSILVFIVQDNIAKYRRMVNGTNAPPKVIYKMDKEAKKIDILIKLGVAMIFVSGLLFATTSWSFINNYIKAFALILFGILFLVLSLFTEQKLKLYRSSYMYWLLSMSLFLLTIVGILYFGIFGEYLTYQGSGSNLAYAITFLTGAGLCLTTYYKFPKDYLLYACYGAIILAIVNIITFLNLSQMMNIAIISLIVMITNIIDRKQGVLHTFSTLLSYILFAFILVATKENELDMLIACSINILNLNYLIIASKTKDIAFINVLLTQIIIVYGISNFTVLGDCIYIMMAILLTIYVLLINGNVIETKKLTQRMNYALYTTIMIVLFLTTISLDKFYVPSTYIFISMFQLAVNIMIKRGLFRMESWKVANYIQPLLVFNIVEAIVTYIHNPLSELYVLAIITIIFSVMYFFYKEEPDKSTLYVYLVLFLIISFSLRVTYDEIFASLAFVLASLFLFTKQYVEENEEVITKIKLYISYLVLLTSLYIPFVHYNVLEINIFIPALIFIILVFIIAPLLKNEWIKKLSYLYIILPLLTLINQASLDYSTRIVLESIVWLYVLFLINKFFVKDDLAKSIITIVGIIVFCMEPFFLEDIIAGIYIGVLALVIILIGYRKEGLYPLFVTGIIMTILNIIYRLKEVWKVIPFWLYLLVGGLTIIGFVTYRELKKQKQKETK